MKGLAIVNVGIEEIACSELSSLAVSKPRPGNGAVFFEASCFEDFFRVCYRSQSALKVLLLLGSFSISDIESMKPEIQKISLGEWLSAESSFVVRSGSRNSSLPKQEIEAMVGEFILEKVDAKVDLESPDVTFFVFVDGKECHFGVDFSGIDLGKRDYRIFTGAETLKPTVAYALVKISGFINGEKLLDPFCRSGTIAVEAALLAKKMPVHYFGREKFLFLNFKKFSEFDFGSFFGKEDRNMVENASSITAADQSFHSISSSKKNAKIAGVEKDISFSRKEASWLDAKFREHEIDRIVSFPPQKSKVLGEKKIEKLYTELFYQADYILKKEGTVTLLLREAKIAEESAKKYNFKIAKTQKIMQGREEFNAVVFSR